MDINGKVAIVTGGASGLGEATVRLYVSLGAKVAIFDMNDERGNALVAELGSASQNGSSQNNSSQNNVIYLNVNVCDEGAVKAALETTVSRFGAVHILNNYAGIGNAIKTVSKGEAFPLNEFTKVIDVNLIGSFNVLRLVAEQMAKQEPVDEDGQRGVLINTASVAAYEGQMGQAAYSASKGAIVGMTLPIARDLAQLGIRCNTIVPGLVHTPLFDALPENAYKSLEASTLYPKRLARPDEVAHLSQYIVESNYTNGECIRIDSGIRMQPR